MASALEHPLRDGSGRDSHGVQVVRQVCPALLVHRDEIRHPDPERAASLAIFFAASIARERLLFADAPHSNSAGLASARELSAAGVHVIVLERAPWVGGLSLTHEHEGFRLTIT